MFDLDACLIDSEELIKQAYRDAGVEPPIDVLRHEGHEWLRQWCLRPEVHAVGLTTNTVHVRKNERYLQLIQNWDVKTLPPWDVALRLAEEGHRLYILSGAPRGTIIRLCGRVDRWPFLVGIDGFRTPDKVRWLDHHPQEGVYIDDQDHAADMPGGWRFIHYTGQGTQELYEELIK